MYVAYFDEVKSNSSADKPWYIIGGIVVAMAEIAALEEKVSLLAEETFGSRELTKHTEFHSSDIYNAKGNFKGRRAEERIRVLASLAAIIGNDAPVRRVYAAINSDLLYKASDAPKQAFMHYCERVHLAIPPSEHGILIGDLDEGEASRMTGDFSRYRTVGTSSQYGSRITRIVDSVHFCRSHHSRLVQLADAYVFRVSDYFNPRTKWMGEQYRQSLKTLNLYPHRYKEWPKSRS